MHNYLEINDVNLKGAFKFLAVSTKMTNLTFLPMLYTWTCASISTYVKMLSYAKTLFPNICGKHLNNSELHKY